MDCAMAQAREKMAKITNSVQLLAGKGMVWQKQ
jgi:hypothetical protein